MRELRKAGEQFCFRHASDKMAENLANCDPATPHAGLPKANCGINTDAIKHGHTDMIEKSYLGCKILGQSQPRSRFRDDA